MTILLDEELSKALKLNTSCKEIKVDNSEGLELLLLSEYLNKQISVYVEEVNSAIDLARELRNTTLHTLTVQRGPK